MARFSAQGDWLQLHVVMSRAYVLKIPRPPAEEYTIYTAVAPGAVFTARTYGTRQLYGPDYRD